MLSATELARELKVSGARVSQYVSEGKLAGCYQGDGRARRFDLVKVAAALGRRLDPGQMMGNGAQTKLALAAIAAAPEADTDADTDYDDVPLPGRATATAGRLGGGSGATELSPRDGDRYDLARTQKAEEEARRLRRMNAEAEGRYVLAAEVHQSVARLIGQEVAEVETVLRDGARRIADQMGVDFKAVRAILTQTWRKHRATRVGQLEMQAQTAELNAVEQAENI
jgi:hypothetical protein